MCLYTVWFFVHPTMDIENVLHGTFCMEDILGDSGQVRMLSYYICSLLSSLQYSLLSGELRFLLYKS